MTTAESIRDLLLEFPNGFTMNRAGYLVSPSSGYAVAIHPFANVDEAAQALDAGRALYVGAWRDLRTVYLDSVVIVPDRDTAYTIARFTKQIAVWNFSASAEERITA